MATVDWAAHERELDNVRARSRGWTPATTSNEPVVSPRNFPLLRFGHLAESWGWCERSLPGCPKSRNRPGENPSCRRRSSRFYSRRPHGGPRMGEEALLLSRELGDRLHEGFALCILSAIAAQEGDDAAYEALASAATAIFRELGADMPLLAAHPRRRTAGDRAGDYARARASLEESLARARALGARDEICNDLCDLGVLALYERRFDDALRLFAREPAPRKAGQLAPSTSLDRLWGIGCGLAAAGDLGAAARLFGAAEALHERLGQPIDDYAVRAYAEGSAPVRERLGEVELAAAWAAGRALSEADAAAYTTRRTSCASARAESTTPRTPR